MFKGEPSARGAGRKRGAWFLRRPPKHQSVELLCCSGERGRSDGAASQEEGRRPRRPCGVLVSACTCFDQPATAQSNPTRRTRAAHRMPPARRVVPKDPIARRWLAAGSQNLIHRSGLPSGPLHRSPRILALALALEHQPAEGLRARARRVSSLATGLNIASLFTARVAVLHDEMQSTACFTASTGLLCRLTTLCQGCRGADRTTPVARPTALATCRKSFCRYCYANRRGVNSASCGEPSHASFRKPNAPHQFVCGTQCLALTITECIGEPQVRNLNAAVVILSLRSDHSSPLRSAKSPLSPVTEL